MHLQRKPVQHQGAPAAYDTQQACISPTQQLRAEGGQGTHAESRAQHMQAWQGPEAHSAHAPPELGVLHREQRHVALHPDGQHEGVVLSVVPPPLHLHLQVHGGKWLRLHAWVCQSLTDVHVSLHLGMVLHGVRIGQQVLGALQVLNDKGLQQNK